jgi:hypothetical protein
MMVQGFVNGTGWIVKTPLRLADRELEMRKLGS